MFVQTLGKYFCLPALLGVTLSAQVPQGFRPMTLWPYQGENVKFYGDLYKNKDGVRCTMTNFSVGAVHRPSHYDAGTNMWVDVLYRDGSVQKVYYQFVRPNGYRLESDPPTDCIGSWHANFIATQEVAGYRLYRNHQLFGQEYFPEDTPPPSIRIWEPSPGKVSWEIRGRLLDDDHLFTRDFAEHWYGLYTGRDGNYWGATIKDFNLKGAQHPLLIRISGLQGVRRYVIYYQLGRGFVSGPEEIGAPKGRR